MDRKVKRRRILRRTAATALVLLGALLLFHRPILRMIVEPWLEAFLEEALGLEVSARVEVDPLGSVTVTGLEASGPAPRTAIHSLSLPELRVEFSPWKLALRKRDWIEVVTVWRPCLALDLDRRPLFPERKENPGPESLPSLDLREGEAAISRAGEVLRVHGIGLRHREGQVSLTIGGAAGPFHLPRPEALRFPIQATARLTGSPRPLDEIVVDRVAMDGRTAVEGLRIERSAPGVVRASAELPWWNLTVPSLEITPRRIDLRVHAVEADLGPLAALITGSDLVRGHATGDLRLLFPRKEAGKRDEEESWTGAWHVEGRVEITEAFWEKEGLKAPYTLVEFHGQGEDRVTPERSSAGLEGEVLVLGLEAGGSGALDLEAGIEREPLPGGDSRLAVRALVTSWDGEEKLSIRGAVREKDLTLEDAVVVASRFPVGVVGRLLTGAPDLEGTLDLEASLEGRPADLTSLRGKARLEVAGLTRGGKGPGASISLSGALEGGRLVLTEGRAARGKDELRFALLADLSIPARLVLTRLEGSAASRPFEAVDLPAFETDGRSFRLEPLRVRLLGGVLSLEARGETGGEAAARIAVEEVDLSGLSGLLTFLSGPEALEGSLSLKAALTRAPAGPSSPAGAGEPGSRPPPRTTLEADFSLEGGAIVFQGRRFDGLNASGKVQAGDDRLRLEGWRLERGADLIELSLALPFSLDPRPNLASGGPLEASFRASLDDLSEIPLPGARFREFGGRVKANGEVRGSLSGGAAIPGQGLAVKASLLVSAGTLKLHGDFPPLTGLEAEVFCEDDRIEVRKLEGNVRSSAFRASGAARISSLWPPAGAGLSEVDFRLRGEDALLLLTRRLRVRGDVDLRWTGPWERSVIAGDLNIDRAYYLEDISLRPGRGARIPFKLFSIPREPFRSARIQLGISSDRGINIRNNLVSTRASANLTLGGTGLDPVLSGTISTDEGTVKFAQSRLKLRSALVELLPAAPGDPRLNIILGKEIRGYSVTVTITGSLLEPEVLLDSSPPLEREKLLVLISTGRTVEEIEETGVENVAAVMAAQYLGYRIARYFQTGDPTEESFLDRFTLETESARSAGYEDPIRVEYRVARDLLLEDDEVFLQGERDMYGDYNLSAGMRFELK